MADDIAPELLEKVQSDYRKLREKDEELARIREKTAAGSADGKDLDAYAVREGELLAEALRNNVSGEALPNGKMYFNIANRVLPPVLQEDYGHVADMAERIQQSMNDKAGIHIRAQRPDLEEDRVKGLVNLAATADQYENIRKELEGDVVNFSQSVATNSVRKNADFQYKAGLSPKIVRTEAAGCCKWCSDLAGTYDYASVKAAGNAVWQRHRGCGCVVEYDPGNGSRQNVHTKQRYDWKEENITATASRIKESEEFERTEQEKSEERKEYIASAAAVPSKMRQYVPDPETRRRIIQEGINEKKAVFAEEGTTLNKLGYSLPEKEGYYTVVCHGKQYYVEFKGKRIDPDTLCAIIAQREDYKKGTDIRLISCYAGTKEDGVARYIADKLGVNVLAADKKAIISKTLSGEWLVYSGSEEKKHDGNMLIFEPKGGVRIAESN